jgi:hypothetical protein
MQQYFIFFVVQISDTTTKQYKKYPKMLPTAKFQLTFLVLLVFCLDNVYGQIKAQNLTRANDPVTETKPKSAPFLQNAQYDAKKQGLPFYRHLASVKGSTIPVLKLEDMVVRDLTAAELKTIEKYKNSITVNFEASYQLGRSRNQQLVYQNTVPVRLNQATNTYEYLESYTPVWDYQTPNPAVQISALRKNTRVAYAGSSVLASGKWYKVGLTQNGVYKMDKGFLSSLGMNLSGVDPKSIRVYGNGGKLMSEKNAEFKYDDLIENAILVNGENDGTFDNGDYVLFYGQSTETWKYASTDSTFNYTPHLYSDTSFYYITADLGTGKRVAQQSSSSATANKTTSSQDYWGFHELNTLNVVKSGREFYGEKFDFNNSYSFNFNIPDAVVGDVVKVRASVLSRSDVLSTYQVSFNNGNFSMTCNATNTGDYTADFGYPGQGSGSGLLGGSMLSVTVSKQTSQAIGYLNKIVFSARRNLIYSLSQFNFRDSRVIGGANTFARYLVTNNSSAAPLIWDVTDPLNAKNQLYTIAGSQLDFTTSADSLKEFCIFTANQAYVPKSYGSVPNQNLHAILQADFVIVTNPLFLADANRVAKLHKDYDGLSYAIATTEQVYNEFSSGTPDIGGIREFVKMLYRRPTNANPLDTDKVTRYLLLLGDGSYKNKPINQSGNSALIPTYQTYNSSSYSDSFTTDDYFAMMDDNEGDLQSGDIVDIGVGRFPVRTKEESNAVTSKIEHYYKLNNTFDPNAIESSCSTAENDYPQGDWRNWMCFLADDEDNNLHMGQADDLSKLVADSNKYFNIDKIYLDAYKQYSTPGGDRYPDVVTDIDRRMEKGALIFNYTGHGGEVGLTEERIVSVPQILAWKNINNMPLMVTATCEFSRFDDPDRTSAGEYCFLNPNGGAIGLMTTVRLAYSQPNYSLNYAFYTHAVKPMINGESPAIGDLYRLTKRDIGFSQLYMNFVILGDPALKLAYPQQRVYTSTINSQTLSSTSSDTLKALSKITVTGFLGDKNGNKLSSFNGVIYPTVFDREITVNTLGNDAGSPIRAFLLQKNSIYRGKSEVKNGDFTFTFLVPKDIANTYGKGKISYYAHNGVNDATGYYNKVVVGGYNANAIPDNIGPAINLYMNDEKFVAGGITNENPKIYAVVSDSSGVNTLGTGIGHDAVAILDENSSKPIVLNDYYSADLNTYQKGKIRYPFNQLADGDHRLSVKVWDVQNNSSISYTDFVVAEQAELALKHILNYPNPFTTKTKFFIEHNQCCVTLKAVIQIYTISGKLVKSINQTINNEGFRFDGIEWDGKDDFGDKLARGVYIYRVMVTDNSQKKAEKIEKLVILN